MKGIDHKFSVWRLVPFGRAISMMRSGADSGGSEMLTPVERRRIDEYFMGELQRLGSDFPYAEFCRVTEGAQAPNNSLTSNAGDWR
jgi:hypothetical protein